MVSSSVIRQTAANLQTTSTKKSAGHYGIGENQGRNNDCPLPFYGSLIRETQLHLSKTFCVSHFHEIPLMLINRTLFIKMVHCLLHERSVWRFECYIFILEDWVSWPGAMPLQAMDLYKTFFFLRPPPSLLFTLTDKGMLRNQKTRYNLVR